MRAQIILCLLVSSIAAAVPSHRPLPPNLPSEDENFYFLRDHSDRVLIYALPKILNVVENQLKPYGNQDEGCKTAERYRQAEAALGEARTYLAKIDRDRAKIVAAVTENQEKFNAEIVELRAKKRQLQKLADDEQNKAAKSALDKEIAVIQADVLELEKATDTLQKMTTFVDKEQGQLATRITALKSDIEAFENDVKRLAARATIKLRPPILPVGEYELPKLIGLSLNPGDANVSNPEQAALAFIKGDKAFVPEWSEESFSFRRELFSKDTNEGSFRQIDFPKSIVFDQLISLIDYCALRDEWGTKQEVPIPLRIHYSFLTWEDESTEARLKIPLFSHIVTPSSKSWKAIANLPVMPVAESLLADPGSPDHFSGRGNFQHRTITTEIKVSVKGESK